MKRKYAFLVVLLIICGNSLFSGGITEGSYYARTILERTDDVSVYFKQVVDPLTLKNGPLQMTVVPLISHTFILSEYPDMRNKRLDTYQMKDQLAPFTKELASLQEMSGTFYVYLRYEQGEEFINTSSFTIDPSFFDYMFIDNDRGEFLRASEFSVSKPFQVNVSKPVYEFWVRFGSNQAERNAFFEGAKDISISVTGFGFEGEAITYQFPFSGLFSDMPEEPKELLTSVLSDITVSFDDGTNITLFENQSYNQKIPEPNPPTRNGYIFDGWYKDISFLERERWDFSLDSLVDDITLFAKWRPETYLVTFDSQGGGTPNPESIDVRYGTSFGNLAAVEKEGYFFHGWMTKPDGNGELVTENTKLSQPENLTLYANWDTTAPINPAEKIAPKKPQPSILQSSGLYYNLIDIMFLYDGNELKNSMPVIGAGYLVGINYKKHGITLGAGIGLNLMMASDILSPPSAEYAESHYANLTLFLPVVSLNPGVFNLAIITDVSLHDLTWSSKLAAKLNLGWVSFSLGVGYFSEAEKVLPYFGFGILNGLTL